jgi:SAM-dependent methyltransferase/dihydrofolate reductase
MLICSMSVSVDGFINDRDGAFAWTPPSDEQFRFHLEQVRELGGYLLGRRLYEAMLVWETDPALRDTEARTAFADVWCAIPKVVFSRTLDSVQGNARLAGASVAEEVAAALDATDKDVAIGGAGLAAAAFELGLVDELRMFRYPIVVGGGTPFLPPVTEDVPLDLIETRTFGSRVIYERYARAADTVGPQMSQEFTAAADKYDRFMGRYTRSLAPLLVEAAGVAPGMRVLDVGCGPGGLTTEVAKRVGGSEYVAAIDPAPQFAAACEERHPGADVRVGVAEDLPWPDDSFDAALSSLVIAFMKDADAGVREMIRVTRAGGVVAACMWDIVGGGMRMLSIFWEAARELDPNLQGERVRPGVEEGDLGERFRRAGLTNVVDGSLEAQASYDDFGDFWEPFTFAVGPAGQHLASLPAADQERVRDACRERLPSGAFALTARAWYARGTVG